MYPLLFALFPILFFYSHNKSELDISIVFKPLLVSGFIVLIIILLFNNFFRNKQKSSIAASILLILFFSFGRLLPVVNSWLLLVFFSIAYAVFFVWIKKSKLKLKNISNFLSVIGLILFFNILFSIARDLQNQSNTKELTTKENVLETGQNINTDSPDIYYLVLDRYANNTSLEEEYNYDNSAFTNYLEEKGFFVSYNSFANYPKTNLSLASTLNMKHITYLTEELGKLNSDTKIAFQLLYNNEAVKLLKNKGYDFIYMGGWWGPTQKNEYADYNFNLFEGANEFNRELLKTTALRPFISLSDDELKRQNISYQFQQLERMSELNDNPKFIFAHIFIPHYPYLFDSECGSVRDTEGKDENKKYLDQLECANKFIKNAVDNILASSKEKPIIIIQSDEGPFKYDEMRRSGEGVDWTQVSDKATRVHMRILNAYYLPNTNYESSQLYNGISPVNSFRVLFNHYFGTEYELLPDKSYFIPHLNYPYDYFEVTDKVKFD